MTALTFDSPDLARHLAELSGTGLDTLPFGVVVMDAKATIVDYNRFEQQLSGLTPDQAMGKDFFTQVAPCTNNFMVRERFVQAWETGQSMDEQVDYVFSFRMKPTSVRLRMMVQGDRGWLVVRHADASAT